MRILVVHNRYKQAGGEDSVFTAETALLEGAGHQVERLDFANDHIGGAVATARAALLGVYNPASRRRADEAIARFRPDVVHVHNIFPTASPAIFYACNAARTPVVWTLHNFRITCANALLMRDGAACEDCLGGSGWPGIRHRCYRGSTVGSAAVTAVHRGHAALGTWTRRVDRFIALTAFSRSVFVRAGLPADKLAIKPNFIADPRVHERHPARTGVLFVGRLSEEKGVDTLLDAWTGLDVPLTVVGDGPQASQLRVRGDANIRFLGRLSQDAVLDAMATAAAVVVPSRWYENFPMTVVEAFAAGTPVIASGLGALNEVVTEGVDGLHFRPNDANHLAAVVREAFGQPGLLARLGQGARSRYERDLTPERNLDMLETIYADAGRKKGKSCHG